MDGAGQGGLLCGTRQAGQSTADRQAGGMRHTVHHVSSKLTRRVPEPAPPGSSACCESHRLAWPGAALLCSAPLSGRPCACAALSLSLSFSVCRNTPPPPRQWHASRRLAPERDIASQHCPCCTHWTAAHTAAVTNLTLTLSLVLIMLLLFLLLG